MKRLYGYILKTFIPLFLMTFAICLFIVLMQFLWKYIDEMVGKGFELSLLGEMFFYAALQLVPMALPLSVLLASIMVFGNMGESLELLAIKSAGISLIKIMRPLIIFIVCISIGAFFYQDLAMPRINAKSFSLLLTIRMASPELNIPEGVFYQEIDNTNIYASRIDRSTGLLHDVFVYDLSNGFNQMRVTTADSARMSVSEDQTMLIFTLYNGQTAAPFNQTGNNRNRRTAASGQFARETFDVKIFMVEQDLNLTHMTEEQIEEGANTAHVAKNLIELTVSIDSMRHVLDSINIMDRQVMRTTAFLTHRNSFPYDERDSIIAMKDFSDIIIPQPDMFFASKDLQTQSAILNSAISRAENNKNEFLFRSVGNKTATQTRINRHWIEWHRKFVMPVTCLIFFFIGAPLGSIVRKGGLGMPIVISVLLFIVYYILENTGAKMARDGVWVHWFGMWFPAFVLLPMGVFLTWKAMNDSTIMNADTYMAFFRKIFFIREKRSYPVKNVIIEKPDYKEISVSLSELSNNINEYLTKYEHLPYKVFWTDIEYDKKLFTIKSSMEIILNQLSNSRRSGELVKAEEFPIFINYVRPFKPDSRWARLCMKVFPVGIIFKLISMPFEMRIRKDLKNTERLCGEMQDVIRQNLRDEAEYAFYDLLNKMQRNKPLDYDYNKKEYIFDYDGNKCLVVWEDDPNFETKLNLLQKWENEKYVIIHNDE
ncbi:MAG: LptF/LptG family permease [Dysgonamonadaceae bacterium]|jgi:lipopolysaccharide export system permease protein|nr:LptF/LptG family permease [Dysgonamonadaceae bacterium]